MKASLIFLILIFHTVTAMAVTYPTSTAPLYVPPTVLPPSWPEVVTSGNYKLSTATSNQYWQIEVVTTFGYRTNSSDLTALSSLPKQSGQTLVYNADISLNQVRFQFGQLKTYQCPAGYSNNSGSCALQACTGENSYFDGICRQSYTTPAGCGSYVTAIRVKDRYVCSSNACPANYSAYGYSQITGGSSSSGNSTWTVCVDALGQSLDPYQSSSSSSASSTPASSASSTPVSSSSSSTNSQVCSDGLPPGVLSGYVGCDRPAAKFCASTNSYVQKTSLCQLPSTVCTDWTSCLAYERNQNPCANTKLFNFVYSSPTSFSSTCTDISTTSPDSPTNGGNADGNIYNDPSTPTSGTGSTLPVSQTDPKSLATAIDSALQDNFDILERGQQNINNQSKTNTDALLTGLSGINDSINNSSNSQTAGLSEIAQKLEDSKPCKPTLENNYCENPSGLTADGVAEINQKLDETTTGMLEEMKQTVSDSLNDMLDQNLVDKSWFDEIKDNVLNLFPSPSSTCTPLVLGNPNSLIHFQISCSFSDKFKQIFSFIIAIQTIFYLVEILLSDVTPKNRGKN